MADEQHRPAPVFGESRHDRVIVGEATIAVNLDEPGEEPLHVFLEARTVGMTGHLHALPRGQRGVQGRARGLDAAPEQDDLAFARVGARLPLEEIDFLQQRRDWLFEIEGFSRHRRQDSDQPAKTR